MTQEGSSRPGDIIRHLRDDYRRHLEIFYAALKLAPPYHSIEQALLHLSGMLQAMSPEEREQVLLDETRQWTFYREAFTAGGLHKKHRGIIQGMKRAGQTTDLPRRYDEFLNTFDS